MYKNIGTFYMNEESLKAIEYLKKENINMSNVVRKALIKEAERQELIKTAFPEDF